MKATGEQKAMICVVAGAAVAFLPIFVYLARIWWSALNDALYGKF